MLSMLRPHSTLIRSSALDVNPVMRWCCASPPYPSPAVLPPLPTPPYLQPDPPAIALPTGGRIVGSGGGSSITAQPRWESRAGELLPLGWGEPGR